MLVRAKGPGPFARPWAFRVFSDLALRTRHALQAFWSGKGGSREPGGFEGFVTGHAGCLIEADLGRAEVVPGKPTHNCSGRHPFVLRGLLDVDLGIGFGSGVFWTARPWWR